jgi:hypothetical protein
MEARRGAERGGFAVTASAPSGGAQGLKVLDAVLPGCETTAYDLGRGPVQPHR